MAEALGIEGGGLLLVVNFSARSANDGGTNRHQALENFVRRRGGAVLEVDDERFRRSARGRLLRLPRLLRQIAARRPRALMLAYPAYPFFWQHKVTPYYWMSRAFARRVKRLVHRGGGRVIVDVMDLPRIQYRDLGLPMEMSLRAFERFDQDAFSNADELWVCSRHLTDFIQEHHGTAVRTVLNGTVPRQARRRAAPADGIVRFLYAGSMNPERGIRPVIESFRRLPHPNARLRLCGTGGEWLREVVADDRRIEYLGSLTDAQAAEVATDCDVGLIPYPETGYYQIAFATKLPFYLELGLPVLVSRVMETGGHVERLEVGLVRPLSEWTEAFAQFLNRPEEREVWNERLRAIAPEFYWETLYGRALEGVTPLLPSRQSS